MATTTLLGVFALPLIGFGAGGVAAGSTAAAWQSSIGAVQAGSIFAILQSLGATGLGSLLFGATGTALGLLGTIAVKLDWCNDGEASVNIKKVKAACGCTTTFKVTVSHIDNLTSVQTEKFKLGDNSWILAVVKKSECLSIGLVGEQSCKVKAALNISSENPKILPIRKATIEDISDEDGFCMDDIITWNELLRAENGYVKKCCFTMEIDITDGKFFVDLCEKDEVKPKLESLFGKTAKSSSSSSKKSSSLGMAPLMEISKTKKSCSDGCLTTMELTVNNVKNIRTLGSRPTVETKIGKINWKLEVSSYDANYLGLKLRGDKECDVRIVIQIRSENASVDGIRKVIIRRVAPKVDLCVNQLLFWGDLREFMKDSALKIEVELTDAAYIRGHISSSM